MSAFSLASESIAAEIFEKALTKSRPCPPEFCSRWLSRIKVAYFPSTPSLASSRFSTLTALRSSCSFRSRKNWGLSAFIRRKTVTMFSTTSTSLPARGLYLGQFLRVGSKRKALRPDSFASRNAWRARPPFGSRTVAPHSGLSISCWIMDSMASLLPQPVGPRMSVCRKQSSAEIETGVGIGLMLGRLVRQTVRSPEFDLLVSIN